MIADRENMIPCVKCGTCRTVCPVNSVCPGEASSARGKMALVEAVSQGHLEGSGLYREYLETCLLCGACEEACPSGVPTLSIMLRARQELTENEGPGRGKVFLIKALVGIPRLLDLVMRTGKAFQGVMFRRIPSESGLRRRFPMPLIPPERTLPGVAQRFFTDDYRGLVRRGTGPRVGIFAGCMTNYLYPGIGAGMVELLAARNATVVVPTDQVCCGMPALTGGARETARELALRNLEAFEAHDLDAVVTGCASCGSNLKENYDLLLTEADVDGSRRERFLAGIMDINEFLSRWERPREGRPAERTANGEAPGLKVTYHHPCHLGRLQGVREQPVEQILSLEAVQYVPMAEADRCCGMGGSFSVEHYDLAKMINDQKIARILETGAEAVVTSCPACILHIRDGLRRAGREEISVLHITELLTGCGGPQVREEERGAEPVTLKAG